MTSAQQMLQDSRTKMELLRMQIIRVSQTEQEGAGQPVESGSALELRVADLVHHMKIESAVADGARNVVKQLSGRKTQDRRVLAEVSTASTAWQGRRGLAAPGVTSPCPQAQARMQESSQKVDLLCLSLERRSSELPPGRHAAIREELLGTPPSCRKPSSSSSSSSSSSFKPASLTGIHIFQQPFIVLLH
ncbi:Serine/threonine-protein kinase N2 [Liparis tanakae]|uniref:Serine/threonine-protein kinase N2 n=1 Tax=Liparis tanakae TaxID=230148 RepID=A0A4Z2EBS3_9TELE|nr:Serine/threonine-protein kinase N2 [Liparis tanakae]